MYKCRLTHVLDLTKTHHPFTRLTSQSHCTFWSIPYVLILPFTAHLCKHPLIPHLKKSNSLRIVTTGIVTAVLQVTGTRHNLVIRWNQYSTLLKLLFRTWLSTGCVPLVVLNKVNFVSLIGGTTFDRSVFQSSP